MQCDPVSGQLLIAYEDFCRLVTLCQDTGHYKPVARSRRFGASIGGIGQLISGAILILSIPSESKL
jgi:hypothetical protein